MSNHPSSVLIVEDSTALALTYQDFLEESGHAALRAATTAEAGHLMRRHAPAAVLLDLHLPGGDGMAFLRELRAEGNTTPVIVMTADTSAETAFAAVRAGADDFISKPVTPERLNLTLKNILERHALRNIVSALRRDRFCDFIGRSQAMQAVYRILENAAASKAPVFITGESGTGKELAARAIHALSQRRQRAFEALNCAAIPASLMESEIFGHVKGAFTGAHAAADGAARRADSGTLFLDELTEMPLELQSKILRFTQTGAFRPVGGQGEGRADVRFVSASNRSPQQAVSGGKLREDLYYRLNVIPVHLPPLRVRGDDVILIAESLLKKIATEEKKKFVALSDDVRRLFIAAPWPGNVRQLENTLRRAVVLHDGTELTADMISGGQDDGGAIENRPEEESAPPVILPLETVERRAMEQAIALCGGNITEAARRLGVNASTIHRKMKKWAE